MVDIRTKCIFFLSLLGFVVFFRLERTEHQRGCFCGNLKAAVGSPEPINNTTIVLFISKIVFLMLLSIQFLTSIIF